MRYARSHRTRSVAHLVLCLPVVLAGLALALGWAAFAPAAHAAGTATYEHRDYAVHILPDGDVSITEHWQVHFSDAAFHHAFLRIYLARTLGIEFGTVKSAQQG